MYVLQKENRKLYIDYWINFYEGYDCYRRWKSRNNRINLWKKN